jgi:threonine/homoserine/homoserine lactone efflux protein
VRHFANHLLRGASAAIAQKVRVGVGGYLALAGSAYLAWCGIQRMRNGPELDREAS